MQAKVNTFLNKCQKIYKKKKKTIKKKTKQNWKGSSFLLDLLDI